MCSHLVAGLQCKEQVVVAILSCIPMAFVSGRVSATKLGGDGRVPSKEGSRLDRHSLYRLRQLRAFFSVGFSD